MNATEIEIETRKVVALRRGNPGQSRGNRPYLSPVFEGDAIHPRWNLIAPPAGRFRIAVLGGGDVAGPSPKGGNAEVYEGHEATARDREVSARDTYETEGLTARLLALGLVVRKPR